MVSLVSGTGFLGVPWAASGRVSAGRTVSAGHRGLCAHVILRPSCKDRSSDFSPPGKGSSWDHVVGSTSSIPLQGKGRRIDRRPLCQCARTRGGHRLVRSRRVLLREGGAGTSRTKTRPPSASYSSTKPQGAARCLPPFADSSKQIRSPGSGTRAGGMPSPTGSAPSW